MAPDASSSSEHSLLGTLPKKLTAEFLERITQKFSPDLELFESAFGMVYKGSLDDGQPIAVKKLANNLPVAHEEQFKNEVANLMAIQHDNIVKLVAYCRDVHKEIIWPNGIYDEVEVVDSLLCYEYAPRGKLDEYIFNTSRPDWRTCFNIIKGICQGLHFLHEEMDRAIVHEDIQAANILLDDNMVPKILHFHLSRLFREVQTKNNTRGSYMTPEYIHSGEISTRSDIYSLGLLILEITVGERSFPSNEDMSRRGFVYEVRQTWTDEHILSAHTSLNTGGIQEVKKCIEIGLECVDVDQNKRPSIVEIVDRLNGRHVNRVVS